MLRKHPPIHIMTHPWNTSGKPFPCLPIQSQCWLRHRCYSGELFFVFGTLYRHGLQSRDDLDLPFSRFTIDSWTTFAWSHNPNPDDYFLAVRGYVNTTSMLLWSGRWESVRKDELVLRQLQAPMSPDVGFRETKQCEALGLPLDYYLTVGIRNANLYLDARARKHHCLIYVLTSARLQCEQQNQNFLSVDQSVTHLELSKRGSNGEKPWATTQKPRRTWAVELQCKRSACVCC